MGLGDGTEPRLAIAGDQPAASDDRLDDRAVPGRERTEPGAPRERRGVTSGLEQGPGLHAEHGASVPATGAHGVGEREHGRLRRTEEWSGQPRAFVVLVE